MQNASLHHSISKIGRSPIGRAGNPANFANDSVVSNYLSLLAGGQELSPSKNKARRHSRIAFKKGMMGKEGELEQAQQEYQEELNNNGALSRAALIDHIQYNHPKYKDSETEEIENWSICENMGSLIICSCMTRRKIPKGSRSLGLGASLYLMSLKAYLKVFFVLSILAIPSCIILGSGNNVANSSTQGGVAKLFSMVSLGNIGYLAAYACNSNNIALQNAADPSTKTFNLTCPRGILSKIISVGLSNSVDQQICVPDKIKNSNVLISDDSSAKKRVYDVSSKSDMAEIKTLTP